MNRTFSRRHFSKLPELFLINKVFTDFVSISSRSFHRTVIVLAARPVDFISVLQRILIVDDEGDFVELMKLRLAGLGCEFLVASDGVQALSQARPGKPNLILLDILLPDLDGLSVCEILKRQPSTKKIPIIFMSALTSEVTRRTVAMQADDFFTKPLDLPRLVRRIADLLHRETVLAE
jgi:CheY-like chemotaxis protein